MEAGLPDHTLDGGGEQNGSFSAENIRYRRGEDGILLLFDGVDGDELWTYSVEVVVGPASAQVVVRCADTLFLHSWAGAKLPALAAGIVEAVRAHTVAFRTWRGQGGVVGLSEMRGIGTAAGAHSDAALGDWLDALYSRGRKLTEGPANSWWLASVAPEAKGALITMGKGVDAVYQTRKERPASERPEYIEYAARVRGVGTTMIWVAVATLLTSMGLFAYTAWLAWLTGAAGWRGFAWPAGEALAGLGFFASWTFAGMRLRSVKSRTLTRVIAVLGMFPCLGPCFIVAIPVGIWAIVVTNDDRAPYVFS